MEIFHKPLRLNKPWLTLFMSNYIAKSTSSFIAVIVLKLSIFVIANAITNLLLTTSVRGQSFSNSGSVSRNSPAAARDVRQENQIHSSKIREKEIGTKKALGFTKYFMCKNIQPLCYVVGLQRLKFIHRNFATPTL